MPKPKPDKCRSCGAPILWSETITGRRAPLDYTPTKEGNILLGLRHHLPPIALVQTQQKLDLLRADGELLYTNHFATCPQSKKWRKK